MKYYVRIGTGDPQVLSPQEIFPLIKAGTITPQTKACAVGATAWSELGQLLPALFAPDAKPPEEEGGAMEFVGKAGHFLAEHGGEVAGLAKTFARRIVVSNFVSEAALPEERAQLEKAAIPVKSPMAQNYAAWRRAILWFSGLGLALAAIVQFCTDADLMFGRETPDVIRLLLIGLNGFQLAAPILILIAAWRWTDIRRSRKCARWGWIFLFLGPLLLFLFPLQNYSTTKELFLFLSGQGGEQMSGEQYDAIVAQSPQASTQINIMIVASFAFIAAGFMIPRIFGLFPGIIRACLTLRTLVPESPLPGSVAALIVPLYSMFLMLALVIASQAGNALVFTGIACLVLSPAILLFNVRLLTQPMDAASMNAHIKRLRIKMSLATATGIVFLIVAISDVWNKLNIEAWPLAATICQLIGNIFLLTLVSSDFFLGLMKFSFDQDKQLRAGPLYGDLETRFADLAQVRLTQIVDEDSSPSRPAVQPPPTVSPPN
jgi:hypothetical protein